MTFPNPALLTHPNIPKPLHGRNPRSILGKDWWDIKRREAYAKHDYHCWACGVHKKDAMYHQWLEGHESYLIDYHKGEVRLNEIVALCHSCHNFIHSGRLQILWQKDKIAHEKCVDILEHGFAILEMAELKPFFGTIMVWNLLTGDNKPYKIDDSPMADWGDWHLILEGVKYYSLFKNIDDWHDYYRRL